jgi:nicotinate-nucleotide--dimethylbenzimidazole phosphoribosyltransferase
MSESLLARTIDAIGMPYEEAMAAARERQDQLTKPAGALGRLETLSIQLAGISGRLQTPTSPCAVIICAADHGITAEGVSAFPSSVTAQMVLNFLAGGAAVNVLARQMGASVTVLDVGVDADLPTHPNLIVHKIRRGTANFAVEAAMQAEEVVAAIAVGIGTANQAIAQGARVLIPGEMGIGNTTPSAAIAAVLTGQPVEMVTGTGTGLAFAGWRHKCEVIRKALALHNPSSTDPIDLLRCVGGLEIAAITGIVLAGAAARLPILLDGVIATAGASIATRLAPMCIPFLVAGHYSQEPGHRAFLDHLGILPLLDLDLRLGEGTGALLALPLLQASVRTLTEMATFDEAAVEKGKIDD